MMLFLKFSLYFTISFLILSIPINHQPLFFLIDEHTSKYTDPIYATAKEQALFGIERGKRFTKKLFSNSIPKESDSVKSKLSARRRSYQELELPSDSYTVEEKELIRRLTTKKAR